MNSRRILGSLPLRAGALLALLAVASCQQDRPLEDAPLVAATLPAEGAFDVPTNTNVAVVFDTPMSAIDASQFSLSDGENDIAGTITMSADGRTFTFDAVLDLAPDTAFEGVVRAGVESAAGVPLVADHRWTFTTGGSPDLLAPTVLAHTPRVDAVGVATNQRVSITFSEPMSPSSINAAILTLRQGGVPVDATVTYAGVSALLEPSELLELNTEYTVTVGVQAVDLAGNPLESAYQWRFTTGDQPDSTPPTVISSSPPAGMAGVATNQAVTVTFSEPMAPNSISAATLTLRRGATPVPATVTYVGVNATLTPWEPLALATEYTVTLDVGVLDLAGNPLESAYEWRFTTGSESDATPPMVSSSWPLRGMAGVAPNTSVTVTFSEPMAPTSISAATLTMRRGAVPISATITYVGLTATLTPWVPLAYDTEYTITLSVGAEDLAGNPLESAYEWRFTTGSEPDLTAPTVVSSSPVPGTVGAAANQSATVTFSEPMTPLTISAATLTMRRGAVPISATVTYVGLTATLTPWVSLAYDTEYTVTLSVGAEDLAGNPLDSAHEWRFTTGSAPDLTAPSVASTSPAHLAAAVEIDASVSATFSEAVTPATVTSATMTLRRGSTLVDSAVTYTGETATLVPDEALDYETEYTVRLGEGVLDLAGNPLAAAFEWRFTTRIAPDIIAPTVSSASPTSAEIGAAADQGVTVTFSEPMAAASVTTSTFSLRDATATPVAGAVMLDVSGTVATFTPTADLTRGTMYEVVLTTGLTDLAGNPLTPAATWTFTTADGPSPVSLGTAAQYVILARTGITTTGVSDVTGNLGLSPGVDAVLLGWGQSAATTFSTSPMVDGRIYVSTYNAPTPDNLALASSDMGAAYAAVAAQGPPDAVGLNAGALGGLTFAPGIYRWNAAATIATNVTIHGGPNDVWVFQVNGALAMAASVSVVLTGGARASNVFWQVNGAINIGATSHFEGIALASTAINVGAGSSVNGRLLAQTAVAVDTCDIALEP